jgi:hypothetical protein
VRRKPRIRAATIIGSILLMHWARIGSLNGLVQTRSVGFWRRWLDGDLASARTIGRVASGLDEDDLRELLHQHYARRRRNKSIKPFIGGIRAVVFDGHESTCSYLRSCPGCLRRTKKVKGQEKEQYYHRYVLAMLLCDDGYLFLDMEEQLPGEGESTCAIRLLRRLLARYPRAFNTVIGDGLYLNSEFCRILIERGKYFLAVLKDERRDLLVDARGLFDSEVAIHFDYGKTHYQCWDIEGFTTWEQLGRPVRVIRSIETAWVRRQRTGEEEQITTEWIWGTNIPRKVAGTSSLVTLGHGRWRIENNGFNELVNEWHADHIYKHHPRALVVFLLLLLLACNVFHALISLNVKPELRARHTKRHFARLIAAEFYHPSVGGFT